MDLHSYALLLKHLNRINMEGVWDSNRTYSKFDIVRNEDKTTYYMSKKDKNDKPVSDDKYWDKFLDFSDSIFELKQLITTMDKVLKDVASQGDYAEKSGDKALEAVKEVEILLDTISETVEETKEINKEFKALMEEAINEIESLEDSSIEFKEVIDNALSKVDELSDIIERGEDKLEVLEETKHVGEYKHGILYKKGNEVEYNGSTYRAKVDVKEVTPSVESEEWQLIAQRGVDGEGAVATVNEIKPDEDGNVTLDGFNNGDILDIGVLRVNDYINGNYPVGFTRFNINTPLAIKEWREFLEENLGTIEFTEDNPPVIGIGIMTKASEFLLGIAELTIMRSDGRISKYTVAGGNIFPYHTYKDGNNGQVYSVEGLTPSNQDGNVSLGIITARDSLEMEDSSKVIASPGAVKEYIKKALDDLGLSEFDLGDALDDIVVMSEHLPSDAGMEDFPKGTSVGYTNVLGDNYPQRWGTLVNFRSKSDLVMAQLWFGNGGGTGTSRQKVYYRIYNKGNSSLDNGWTPWYKIIDDLDKSDSTTSNSSNKVATSKAVKYLNDALIGTDDSLRSHKRVIGDNTNRGHVYVIDDIDSNLSSLSGYASSPLAVNEVRKIAEQALESGNKQKKRMVDSLLSADDSLPIDINSSWDVLYKHLNELIEDGGTLEAKRATGYIIYRLFDIPTVGTIYEEVELPHNTEIALEDLLVYISSKEIVDAFSTLLLEGLIDSVPGKEEELKEANVVKMISDLSVLLTFILRTAKKKITDIHASFMDLHSQYKKTTLSLVAAGKIEELGHKDGSLVLSIEEFGTIVDTILSESGVETENVPQYFRDRFVSFSNSVLDRDYINVENLNEYDVVVATQEGVSSTSDYTTISIYLGKKVSPFYNATVVTVRLRGISGTATTQFYRDGEGLSKDRLPLHSNYREGDGTNYFKVYKFKM